MKDVWVLILRLDYWECWGNGQTERPREHTYLAGDIKMSEWKKLPAKEKGVEKRDVEPVES